MQTDVEKEPVRFPDGSARSLSELIAAQPAHAVVELAPGRYTGPLVITKPVTIRGAGDLTRIRGDGKATVITVDVPREGRVSLESLLVEGGAGARGGGVSVAQGRVRLHNVHVQRCRVEAGVGGAIGVWGGEVEATLLRVHDVSAERGGAIWCGGRAIINVRDAQIRKTEARFGGAIAVEDGAQLFLEALTIGKSKAGTMAGGQAIWIAGAAGSGYAPVVSLRKVRFEDAPFGMPVVVDSGRGEVTLFECDVPRLVLGMRGVVDGGSNRWR